MKFTPLTLDLRAGADKIQQAIRDDEIDRCIADRPCCRIARAMSTQRHGVFLGENRPLPRKHHGAACRAMMELRALKFPPMTKG
jgi:hypothetical protein